MKINTKHLFFSMALVFVGMTFAESAQAQRLNPWNWKKYGLKFKLPGNWNVKDKGGRSGKFTASGPGVTFRLKPWRDASRSAKGVALAAYRSSTSVKNKRIVQQRYMQSKGGLKKYMIVASGYQKGRKVMIGIMGFINPNSSVNLYARFFWWADGRNARTNNNITYKVAQSFAAATFRR